MTLEQAVADALEDTPGTGDRSRSGGDSPRITDTQRGR